MEASLTTVSSNSSSLQEIQGGQQASVPYWQRGCYQKYNGVACDRSDCPYVHDLSMSEIRRLLDWKHEQQRHLIFDSHSTSNQSNSQSRESSANEHEPMTELLKDASSLPSMGPERQQLLRRLRKHFKAVGNEQLAEVLPRDELGRGTSIGSLLHRYGTCKPCRNIVSSPTCSDGLRCCFCHLPHTFIPAEMVSSATDEHGMNDTRRPGRPSQSQRDKYRRVVDKVEAQIRRDPFGWTPDGVNLPDEIFNGRADLKNKLFMRLAEVVDKAKTEIVKDGQSPSSSSAAAMPTANAAVSSSRPSTASQNDAPLPVRGRRLVRL